MRAWILLVLVGLLGLAPPALAGSYTVTTTAEEDAALAAVMAETKSPLTPSAYIQAQVSDLLKGYVKQTGQLDAKKACDAYRALTAIKQNAVKALLEGRSPCEP